MQSLNMRFKTCQSVKMHKLGKSILQAGIGACFFDFLSPADPLRRWFDWEGAQKRGRARANPASRLCSRQGRQ